MVSSMMSSRFGEGFRWPSDREDIVYGDRGQLGLKLPSSSPVYEDLAYGPASSRLRVSPVERLMAFTVSVRRSMSARFAVRALLRSWWGSDLIQ